MKYSKKVLFDYINGNDIENYSIDDLEDDYLFMMDVIENTNDKNIYNLCSLNVKKNHEFVKYLIRKFNDDGNFICSVVNFYLENIDEDDIRYKEIIILIYNCCDKSNNDLLSFATKALAFYHSDWLEIEILLNEDESDYWKNDSGMGFCLICNEYSNSKIVKDFFAQKFINEIFYNGEYSFEKIIHSMVKDYKIIEDMGVNNFFINFIRKHDNSLANYVCCNLTLLNGLKKDLAKVKLNWDNYVERLNQRRIDIVYQELDEYLGERDLKFDINQFMIINIAVKRLGLESVFYKYDRFNCFSYFELEDISFSDNKLNIIELECLKFTIKLISDLFRKDVIVKRNIDSENNKNISNENKGKILFLHNEMKEY